MSVAESVLRHIHRQAAANVTDASLLRAYVESRSDDAFRAIVERHGPMVLRTCRRRLGDAHAAEDAFQATFLALSRSAKSIRQSESLAGWLFRTAQRFAAKAQSAARRRQRTERRALTRSPNAPAELTVPELLSTLDDELGKLADRDRLPILLVYWQGRSYAQAARELNLTTSALHGRLERGRARLAERLRARGITPGDLGALLAAVLVPAAVPADLLAKTAALTAAGAVIPASVLALASASGGGKVLSVTIAAALIVGVGTIGIAGGWAEPQKAEEKPNPPVAHAPGSQKSELRVDRFGDPLPEGAVARLGTVRLRPGKEIEALAFSPDGQRLACWAGSIFMKGELTIWEVATGRLLRRIEASQAKLKLLHWLPDGRGCALMRTGRATYYVWDFADESSSPPIVFDPQGVYSRSPDDLMGVTVSPDGQILAVGKTGQEMNGRAIEIYTLALNRPLNELKSRSIGKVVGHCVGLVFTSDSRILLSLGRTQESDRPGPFIPGGPRSAFPGTLAENARLTAWDVDSGREIIAYEVGAPSGFSDVMGAIQQIRPSYALGPDDAALVIGQRDGTIRIWDWRTGREKQSWKVDSEIPAKNTLSGISVLALSRDGKSVFTGGALGGHEFWDMSTKRTIGRIRDSSMISSVAVAPTGNTMAIGGNEGEVALFDFGNAKPVLKSAGHRSWIQKARVQSDGQSAVTVGIDGSICQWDLADGRELKRVRIESPQRVWPIAFSDDGRGMIGVTPDLVGRRVYCDVETGKCRPLGTQFTSEGFAVLSSPVGNAVLDLDRDEKTVIIRDWPSGRMRHRLDPPALNPPVVNYTVSEMALSPEAKHVVVLGREFSAGKKTLAGRISLVDTATGTLIHTANCPNANFEHAVFVPDGSGILVGGEAIIVNTIVPRGAKSGPTNAAEALQLVDRKSGKFIRVFSPKGIRPTDYRKVTAIAISPDGRLCAAAESDHSIWLYDFASSTALRQFAGHRNEVTSLNFTPDGRRLLSTSRDSTAMVWNIAR